MSQTIQQQRARFALIAVQAAREKLKEKERKEYKNYASSLPFMIKANGLGQAAAFYRSKGGAYKELYDLLSNWLVGKEYHKVVPPLNQPFHGEQDLLEGITKNDINKYLAAQAEAMIFLQWVKQFTNAFMED